MQNRPFQTVEEMNRILLQNFNACVGKSDIVYILGDICHHMPIEAANNTISSLHGKKYLINGNHDKKYEEKLFEEICDFKVVSLNGETVVLMHYPMMSCHGQKTDGVVSIYMDIYTRIKIIIG